MGEKPLLKRDAVPSSADPAGIVPELSGWLTKTAVVQPLGAKKPTAKRKREASGHVQGGRKRRGQEEDYTGWENETEASAIVATYMPEGGKEKEYVRRRSSQNSAFLYGNTLNTRQQALLAPQTWFRSNQ